MPKPQSKILLIRMTPENTKRIRDAVKEQGRTPPKLVNWIVAKYFDAK